MKNEQYQGVGHETGHNIIKSVKLSRIIVKKRTVRRRWKKANKMINIKNVKLLIKKTKSK